MMSWMMFLKRRPTVRKPSAASDRRSSSNSRSAAIWRTRNWSYGRSSLKARTTQSRYVWAWANRRSSGICV
jgi:hypothetical protein